MFRRFEIRAVMRFFSVGSFIVVQNLLHRIEVKQIMEK